MDDKDKEDTENLMKKDPLPYMLKFEEQIFQDITQKDALVVAAKGLNLDLVIANVLKVYCEPGNLVLVLNATENEEKYYKNVLNDPNIHSITTHTSTNVNERQDMYLSGGIHFVTTRIVVVDMLKKRIPVEKITGFVVMRAHSIFESCQEAFVLRLFRQNNKTGFVKGFSNSAQSFTVGFGHVERVMRALFVKELYIYPRFHTAVIMSFVNHEPKVIELHIPISEKMKKIQTHILDLMNLTVKELKRINKGVELQEITVENCLTKKFHKILQAQLDVIWHQLSGKSRQLIADLKTLRHLIVTMLYSDPVTFYSTLSGYRTMEYAQTSSWVLFEPAELLFSQMNSLIFNQNKEFSPEFCPKWEPLLEILKAEIPSELKTTGKKEAATILILTSDNRTCHQLNELLTHGPHHYLLMMAAKRKLQFKDAAKQFKNIGPLPEFSKSPIKDTEIGSVKAKKLKTDEKPKDDPDNKIKENGEEQEEKFQSSYLLTMSQTVYDLNNDTTGDTSLNDSSYTFEPFTQMENMNFTQISESISAPKIIIQTFKGSEYYTNLQHTLEDLKPSFIIMYHCSITAVREIEMYEAHREVDNQLKVYFLIHADTVEEQSYLTTLRREKECFEFLIETKSTMVVPEDQDGKTEMCSSLERDLISPIKNTREGGKDQAPKKRTIIVDMREFRSELPALIHKRGIDIEPVTITVGDYILTSEICVERKSLSDLIGSLNSGRLHQQCTQMFRYYPKPMLLIEFDQSKPFGWQNNYMLSNDGNSFDIQQKLLLLTLHFPKLKLIWSPSPYATAQLFEELKVGKDEPNVEYASSIGSQQDIDLIESKYNPDLYDFVQQLPGITTKNIDGFLRNTTSLVNAVNKTEDEFKEILGNTTDARSFYSILHENPKPKEELDTNKNKGKPKARFKYCRK